MNLAQAKPTAAIDIGPPDLSPWAGGNTGTPYVWTFAAREPGPHVLLQGLTHGNELCGAIALDWLLREAFRPQRGTLTVCFANVGAFTRFDTSDPFASRCVDEDFNRLWTQEVLDGARASAELSRARELRPFYDRADHLLDLHSMTDPCPPLSLAGRLDKGQELARGVGIPQHIVVDAGHAAGKRLRDYAAFDDPASTRSALLIECGQHWEASSPHVAKQATLRFLCHFAMAAPGFVRAHLDASPPPPQKVIEVTDVVTIATDRFAFALPVKGLAVVAREGTLLANDGDVEIRAPYDECVLIMPTRRPKPGETAVRLGRFVS